MKENLRYSAKLMFQFRVMIAGKSNKRRIVEQRIILFEARSAEEALISAKNRGKREEYNYKNDDGNDVFFEFVGVVELIHLGIETQTDEVWYDISEKITPLEKIEKHIPKNKCLSAFKYESKKQQSS